MIDRCLTRPRVGPANSQSFVPALIAKRNLALLAGRATRAQRLAQAILVCTGGARFYRTPQHTLEYGLLDAGILAVANVPDSSVALSGFASQEQAIAYALGDDD
jgi:hypothetical protein